MLRHFPSEGDPDYIPPQPQPQAPPQPPPPPRQWADLALDAVKAVAAEGDDLTSVQVWDRLALWGVPLPPEPREMGAVMVRARRLGIVTATDQFEVSPLHHPTKTTPRRIYHPGQEAR